MSASQISEQRHGRRKALLFGGVVLLLAAGAAVYFWISRPAAKPTAQPGKAQAGGGTYADLAPAQKRLVDDWVDRFNKAMGKQTDAAELYDALALSTRTTFNAVSHALSRTELTDGSGQPMNLTALDLVARVETVAGSMPGKGGDKQFRMYIELKPGTREILEQCREFSRQPDNTVFHKGYPVCFRSSSGTPSIQFSLSRDGRRGDIDVDYRSSSFPIMLVNGHLTASNSDVRAGDNDQRHNTHWSGLRNWWRGFMGLPFLETPRIDSAVAGGPVSNEPRLGKDAKPEEAIHDFLKAWLVDQDPGVSVGYVSARAFACMEVERGTPVDRGVARFQLLRAMESVNRMAGKAASLSEIISGVTLAGPRVRIIPQPHHEQFVMYDVREDLAEEFDCENRLHPEQADPEKARSAEYGEYVGAVFQLRTPSVKGEVVATIWAKDKSGWMLMSYDVEPELRPGGLAAPVQEQSEAAEPPLQVIDGAPGLARAVAGFHEAWFLKKDAAVALRYLSPSSFSCYNVYRPENLPEAGSPEEAAKMIQERMKAVADFAGPGSHLEDVITAAEPHHHDLKMVRHGQPRAFALVSVPDSMGQAADCAKLKRDASVRFDHHGPNTYGRFFAAGTRLKRAGPGAAVLWTVWSRQGPAWKIVSYLVIAP